MRHSLILIFCFLILIFNLFSFSTGNVYAGSEQVIYARIMFDQVFLYRTPYEDNSMSNVFMELPKTYFVELTDSANENFYAVRYSSLTGYVKKECVQAIDSAPIYPFLDNLKFRVYAELSRDMRSAPTTVSSSSSQVVYLPNLTRNLTYLGKINGETLIEGRTSIWYYAKYSADKEYFGYVYSDFCDELPTKLPTNTEEVNYITNPTFQKAEIATETIPITDNVVPVIVGILCVPALIFALMVMKGKNILTKEHKPSGEVKDY